LRAIHANTLLSRESRACLANSPSPFACIAQRGGTEGDLALRVIGGEFLPRVTALRDILTDRNEERLT
jgi:hypothetical protein